MAPSAGTFQSYGYSSTLFYASAVDGGNRIDGGIVLRLDGIGEHRSIESQALLV